MLSFTQFITESVDIATDYHPAPKGELNVARGPGSSIVGGGAVKDKSGKTHLSVYHHNNGHTYIHDHGGGRVYKSNKAVHHSSKHIAASYADNNGEEASAYKGI